MTTKKGSKPRNNTLMRRKTNTRHLLCWKRLVGTILLCSSVSIIISHTPGCTSKQSTRR
jgi:hypothetical protein